MNGEDPRFVVFMPVGALASDLEETMIVFSVLNKQFANYGIDFTARDLVEKLLGRKDDTDLLREYLKEINDCLHHMIISMGNDTDFYYHLYGVFIHLFKKYPPKCDEDVHLLVVTVYLNLMAVMSLRMENAVKVLVSVGVADDLCGKAIRAALDAHKYLNK